jgi:RNA polymerase primary sigma factor
MTTEQRQLVQQHIVTVYGIARRLVGRQSDLYLDLVQEGLVGLCRAVYSYDPTTGFAFSTYSAYWARKYMVEFLRKATMVVKPEIATLRDWRLRKLAQRVYCRTGIRLDAASDSSYGWMSLKDVHAVGDAAADSEDQVLRATVNRVSQRVLTPYEQAVLANFAAGNLDVDYARAHGISRERVRQIRNRAMERLQKRLAV